MSIKKYIFLLIGIFAIVCIGIVGHKYLCAYSSGKVSYIQLTSNVTQLATTSTANKHLEANLNSQDEKYGTALSWDRKYPNIITINEDGTYFLMTSAQVGAKEHEPFEGGNVMLWYTVNGKVLTNSAMWVFAGAMSRAKNIVSQMIVQGKKGDKIGLLFSCSVANGGLLAYPDDPVDDLPGATSLTVSMFKLG